MVPAEGLVIDTLQVAESGDILIADSIRDVSPGMSLLKGIVIENAVGAESPTASAPSYGTSWLLSALILIFAVACLRYRKNSRFFLNMFQSVTEVRERHNAFDDTFRETTFVWLLNVLWCGAAAILFYGLLYPFEASLTLDAIAMKRLGICIGMGGAYTLFLTISYSIVGNVFSDGAKASLWTRGYLSSQGLEAVILLPAAVLGLCIPGLLDTMLVVGAILFILAKLLFIYKGFCIFFSQFTSLVLFLYYLCSLEIVPIVLTYVSTRHLCSLL